MKSLFIGIGVGILAIALIIGYVVLKERQVRQLEDELAIAESKILVDTLIVESTKVIEKVDTAYVARDRVIDKIDTLIEIQNDTVYAHITKSGTAYFDTVLTPGRNRIKLNMEFDYPEPQLRLMAGYSFYQKPPKRFGVGLFIGSGITGQRKFDFILGVGLTFRIRSF